MIKACFADKIINIFASKCATVEGNWKWRRFISLESSCWSNKSVSIRCEKHSRCQLDLSTWCVLSAPRYIASPLPASHPSPSLFKPQLIRHTSDLAIHCGVIILELLDMQSREAIILAEELNVLYETTTDGCEARQRITEIHDKNIMKTVVKGTQCLAIPYKMWSPHK